MKDFLGEEAAALEQLLDQQTALQFQSRVNFLKTQYLVRAWNSVQLPGLVTIHSANHATKQVALEIADAAVHLLVRTRRSQRLAHIGGRCFENRDSDGRVAELLFYCAQDAPADFIGGGQDVGSDDSPALIDGTNVDF